MTSRDRGGDVPCPMRTGRRTSVSDGKIRIHLDDPTTSRASCLGKIYGKQCDMCPNSAFEARFKSIGSAADYQWLDEIINRACAAIDARVTKKIRSIEHCCPDHGDAIVVAYDFEAVPSAVIDKKSLSQVYDMIMEGASGDGVIHEVLHVHARRHDHSGKTFDLRIALKQM